MSDGLHVRYRINARDEIIHLDEGWRRFAIDNDAAEFFDTDVVGRPLWDFITDETTRRLYSQIIARVRAGSVAQFTLRCDGPGCRRMLEMTIRSAGTEIVEFATRTARAERRPPMSLLARDTVRTDEFIRACAWCNRIEVGVGVWAEVEEATQQLGLFEGAQMPQMSHGICESCLEQMDGMLASMPEAV